MLVWGATCPDTFAPSYLAKATSGPGLVAASAEDRKRSKYSFLVRAHPPCGYQDLLPSPTVPGRP